MYVINVHASVCGFSFTDFPFRGSNESGNSNNMQMNWMQ